MAIRSETLTRHTYYATIGSIELYQEDMCAKVDVSAYRTKDPQHLREFAQLCNDIAALMEMEEV